MTNREQAIKRVAEAFKADPRAVEFALEYDRGIAYAVDTTERVLELEAALKEIANTSSAIWHDMDENAMGRSTMRLIAREARAALQPKDADEPIRDLFAATQGLAMGSGKQHDDAVREAYRRGLRAAGREAGR